MATDVAGRGTLYTSNKLYWHPDFWLLNDRHYMLQLPGIDVKDVSLVINYDMAKTIEMYTHR